MNFVIMGWEECCVRRLNLFLVSKNFFSFEFDFWSCFKFLNMREVEILWKDFGKRYYYE